MRGQHGCGDDTKHEYGIREWDIQGSEAMNMIIPITTKHPSRQKNFLTILSYPILSPPLPSSPSSPLVQPRLTSNKKKEKKGQKIDPRQRHATSRKAYHRQASRHDKKKKRKTKRQKKEAGRQLQAQSSQTSPIRPPQRKEQQSV